MTKLYPSCLLKVLLYSPDSTLHLGTAGRADSTLHLSIAYRADSTLHLGIGYRVDSHDTTYRVYIHDTAYRADSFDTAYNARTFRCLGIIETSFDPIRSRSLSRSILFPYKAPLLTM